MFTNQDISQLDPLGAAFGGYNNLLTPYLGPVVAPEITNAYEKRNRAILTVPDGKVQQSQFLAETILDLTFTANQTFLTEVICPYTYTNFIHFTWKKTEYNAHMMTTVPELSVSEIMTERSYTRTKSLLRKGIAFEYSHDFYRTPEGRISFSGRVGQTALSVQETVNVMVIDALLHSNVADVEFIRQNKTVTDKTIRTWLEKDRDRFGLAIKEEHGLEKLSVEINTELDQHSGVADTFIMPQSMSDYLEFRPESIEFYRSGIPKTQTVMTAHPLDNPIPTRFIKDSPVGVFLLRSKYVENFGISQPLGRDRQNGSYNTMRMRPTDDYDDYYSSCRTIRVMDEDHNGSWGVLDIKTVLQHAELFDDNGKLLSPETKAPTVDFLVDSNTSKPITYIGSMGTEYLDSATIMNCIKGLKGSINKQSPNLLDSIAPLLIDDDDLSKSFAESNNKKSITKLVNILKKILGADNVAYKTPETAYKDLILQGKGEVIKKIPEGGGLESKVHDDTLISTLIAPTQETAKHDEIKQIAANPQSKPILDVAEEIRQKMIEYCKAKLKGPAFTFKKTSDVNNWFKARIDKHKAGLAGIKQTSGGYMKTGLDLSGTNYEYVDPASAQNITHPIARVSYFRKILESQKPQSVSSQRNIHNIGSDLGFAGISHQNIGVTAGGSTQAEKENIGGIATQFEKLDSYLLEAIDKLLLTAFLTTKFNQKNLESMILNNVPIPIDFIIARPHQQRHTQSIIKCAAMGKSGRTYFTLPGVEIGHSAVNKSSHAHYTMDVRPIIDNPQNVYVARDVFVDGYNGGYGMEFYDRTSYQNIKWDDVKHSIICMAIPVTEKRIGDSYGTMDMKGYMRIHRTNEIQDGRHHGEDKPHYSTYLRYNSIYGFDRQMHRGSARPDASNAKHHLNTICEPAGQCFYNPKSGQWSLPTANCDHWGPIFGPGSADLRRGKKRYVSGMKFISSDN